jgi:hypothetical protein
MPPDANAAPSSRFDEAPRRSLAREMQGYPPRPGPGRDPRQADEQLQQLTAELQAAHQRIRELEQRANRSAASARVEQLLTAARQQAAEFVQAARVEAEQIRAAAQAQAAEVRGDAKRAAERERSSVRASADREADTVRASAEREAAQVRASANRERDDIVTAAKREADDIRRREQFLLEQSESLRTQAEAELEVELAARREDAERHETERLADAQATTRALVAEAERRAADAEGRAAAAIAQADHTRRDAERDAAAALAEAREKADQVVTQATAKAAKALADFEVEAALRREAVQRELDELTKQKNDVSGVLAQMRQVFNAGM